MKAERRHELETNSLALWLRWRAPQLWEKYGTRILLGIIFVVLAIVLIRYRLNAPKAAAAAASENLNLARSLVEQLRGGAVPPGEAAQALKLITDALDRSDYPLIQAEGYLSLGDYYWTLANYPEIPEAATQPSLRPAEPRDTLLSKAEEAYNKVLKVQGAEGYVVASARMGLAAIAENRAFTAESQPKSNLAQFWAAAKEQYEAIINTTDAPQVLKEEAKWHLESLVQLQEPVWLVEAPSTQPAAAQPEVPVAGPQPLNASASTQPVN